MNLEPNLFSLPISVKNQDGEIIPLNAVYQDSMPDGSNIGTCIGLHGCPGSHKDFKYIEPLLTKAGVRFIGINFAGFGLSSYDERLKNDNFERNQFVQQIIDGLKLKENLVLMGHSRGTENALAVTAENDEKISGLIILNGNGISHHRGVRPRWRVNFFAFLWTIVWLRFLSNWLLYLIYTKFLKMKVQNGHEAGVCVTTIHNNYIEKQKPYVDIINQKHTKVFLAAGGKDWLIESRVSKEFMSIFHDAHHFETSTTGEEPQMIDDVLKQMEKGSKSISVIFKNEGHFLQKVRAKLISQVIVKILSQNNNK